MISLSSKPLTTPCLNTRNYLEVGFVCAVAGRRILGGLRSQFRDVFSAALVQKRVGISVPLDLCVLQKMHKIADVTSPRGGEGEEGFVNGDEKNATGGTEETEAVVRIPQEIHRETMTTETDNPPPIADSQKDSQPGQGIEGAIYGSEEYNMLLIQYNELEEKRAKILEQLHASWNNQYSGEAVQDYATTANQAIPETTDYAPSLVANIPMPADDETVKKGMEAAQKAISSLRIANGDGANEGEEKKAETVTSCTTDLSVVLNAWYSAGLYTGKYLTEQSLLKRTNP